MENSLEQKNSNRLTLAGLPLSEQTKLAGMGLPAATQVGLLDLLEDVEETNEVFSHISSEKLGTVGIRLQEGFSKFIFDISTIIKNNLDIKDTVLIAIQDFYEFFRVKRNTPQKPEEAVLTKFGYPVG